MINIKPQNPSSDCWGRIQDETREQIEKLAEDNPNTVIWYADHLLW